MALITCPECGKEVSDKAATCPNCGCPIPQQTTQQNYQQPVYRTSQGKNLQQGNSGLGITALIFSILGCTFIIGAILAIVDLRKKDGRKKTCSIIGLVICSIWLIISIVSVASSPDKVKEVPTAASATVTDKEPSELEAAEKDVPAATDNSSTAFHTGETAEYNDVQVTLLNYTESNGNDWGGPAEGHIFVYPELEILNNSSEEISLSSLISFECYCDDYKLDFSSEALMAISTENGMQDLSGSIASGKKLKGVLGLEVPADWQKIEIYYKDNVWLSSNFSFEILK